MVLTISSDQKGSGSVHDSGHLFPCTCTYIQRGYHMDQTVEFEITTITIPNKT